MLSPIIVVHDGTQEHRLEAGTAAAAFIAFVVANAERLDSPHLCGLTLNLHLRAELRGKRARVRC